MNEDKQMEQIKIGKVTGTVGIRGEIKIFHDADEPDALRRIETLIIDKIEYTINNIRYKKKIPVIKLHGVDDIDKAETLIKKEIFIDAASLPDLSDGSYYIKDLKGLDVVLAEDGTAVGILNDVIPGSAQDLYEVTTTDGKTMLIPAITDFIREISIEDRQIKVELPDGIEDTKY